MKLDRISKDEGAVSLDQIPEPADSLALPESFGRRFLVVGDCEEEFDWAKPLDRASTGTSAIAALPEATRRFAQAGVVPTYVVDWPVAADPRSSATMAEMAQSGLCDIGAHLHPWVNPPHDEEVNRPNSFAGMLPFELERAKLATLTARLTKLTGKAPIAYRAGRYGIGPNSESILAELGYCLDLSVRSHFDYSNEGGPDFTDFPIRPWRSGGLIEVPLTTCLAGPLGRVPSLTRIAALRGPFARTGLLNRIPLTPEGVPLAEAKQAIEVLLDRGHRLFSLWFHTPTVEPGHTAYVRDSADLRIFRAWWDGVFDLFARNGVTPVRSGEIVDSLAQA
ncbi:MAG: polysaccharide deacetylase family protein [Allosphingosinicella sp.]